MPSAYSNIVQVHVIGPTFFTSRPYPIQVIEALTAHGDVPESPQYEYQEAMELGGDLVAGDLETVLLAYTDGDPEALALSGDLVAGELNSVLVTYEDGDPEAIKLGGDLIAGELKTALVTYDNGLPEALKFGGDLIGGTLT